MSNTITVKDDGGSVISPIEYSNSLSLTGNSSNRAVYQGQTVGRVEAELSASTLTITLTPQTGVGALYISDVDATPYPQSTVVTGGLTWAAIAGGGLELTFTTPGTSGHEVTWTLNSAAPPIRLTVKIKRL